MLKAAEPNATSNEIETAVSEVELAGPRVGVEPRRVTEAWLLLDEPAIREVVGRGWEILGLPSPQNVESLPDPKARLREVLLAALAPRGRCRRKRFELDWPQRYRNCLLENLPIGGPLAQVPS